MEPKCAQTSPLKKTLCVILVSLGGVLICSGALAAFARLLVNRDIEVEPTAILLVLGSGLIYGGAALWYRWRLAFGIFLTVIGVLFGISGFVQIPNKTEAIMAVKYASLVLSVSSLIIGITMIITQNSSDNKEQTTGNVTPVVVIE